ncbi:MAG: hypothetical protein JSU96_08910 [Acidobacteriota bacterium]|nr:MAG: hypothetical protein JSU96_08910 [Acidobacteriota bacterium]
MAAKLIRGHHPDTSAEAIRELVDEQSLFVRKGCIYTTFFYLVVLPVKFVGFLIARLFRTILFFLAIKFVSDRASEVFHWGYLIAYSATKMAEAPPLSLHKARVLRQAIESSLEELNTSPVYGIFTRIIRFNKQILSEAARVLRRSGRQVRPGSPGSSADFRMKEMLGEERSLLEKLAHQLADLLGGDQDYLKSIAARMDVQARKLGLF